MSIMPGKKKGGKIGMKRNRNKKTLTEVKYINKYPP
jgi:hypothetical protein